METVVISSHVSIADVKLAAGKKLVLVNGKYSRELPDLVSDNLAKNVAFQLNRIGGYIGTGTRTKSDATGKHASVTVKKPTTSVSEVIPAALNVVVSGRGELTTVTAIHNGKCAQLTRTHVSGDVTLVRRLLSMKFEGLVKTATFVNGTDTRKPLVKYYSVAGMTGEYKSLDELKLAAVDRECYDILKGLKNGTLSVIVTEK